MYPIMRIDPSLNLMHEQLGSKRKYWIRVGGVRVLFKAEERGTGEDWAEKVACELAELIGLPHVHYDLAVENGTQTPGVICASCAPPPLQLVMGNQILPLLDNEYPTDGKVKERAKAHTINAVATAIGFLDPPPAEWLTRVPEGIKTAADVFVGYLMLDAWIANQDRHHENWAAMMDANGLYLAPSYDHGAAMARNITDEARQMRLTTADRAARVGAYARRARSAFFDEQDDARRLSTHDAWLAFAQTRQDAARIWLERLGEVGITTMDGILGEIPPQRMSAVCRQFTLKLLESNQHLLLDTPL